MNLPRTTYAICTTPRTGSNLLCDLLTASWAMGEPMEVFNAPAAIASLAVERDLLGPGSELDIRRYLELRLESTTPNGVFGMKLLFDQLEYAIRFECVRELLSNSLFVYLSRRDLIAQAVSSYMARALGAWSLDKEESSGMRAQRPLVPFDREAIAREVARLTRHSMGWLEFFSVNDIDVLAVTYEELIADPSAVCHAVCRYCGVETDFDFSLVASEHEKQGDATNEDLRSRFVETSRLSLRHGTSNARENEVRRAGLRLYESKQDSDHGDATVASAPLEA